MLEKANIELLKLVALCKDVAVTSRREGYRLLNDVNIKRLIDEGLLYISKGGRYYRATQLGYDLLNLAGYDEYRPDEVRAAHKHILDRRDRISQVMLTLIQADIDVFASDVSQLHDDSSFLPIVSVRRMQRRSGINTTSNTRFAGLMNRFIFYYMADPKDALYLTNETRTANNMLSRRNRPEGTVPKEPSRRNSSRSGLHGCQLLRAVRCRYITADNEALLPLRIR